MERNAKGQFVRGTPSDRRCDVGAIRIRTRHKREGEQRKYIKVAEPNKWILYCRFVWMQQHGQVPPGMAIHHRDGNTLNDSIENLQLVSKSEHLAIHRPEFQGRAIDGLINARRERRWSTKSATKRTGRPPVYEPSVARKAAAAYLAGSGTQKEVATRFGITVSVLQKQVSAQRT